MSLVSLCAAPGGEILAFNAMPISGSLETKNRHPEKYIMKSALNGGAMQIKYIVHAKYHHCKAFAQYIQSMRHYIKYTIYLEKVLYILFDKTYLFHDISNGCRNDMQR